MKTTTYPFIILFLLIPSILFSQKTVFISGPNTVDPNSSHEYKVDLGTNTHSGKATWKVKGGTFVNYNHSTEALQESAFTSIYVKWDGSGFGELTYNLNRGSLESLQGTHLVTIKAPSSTGSPTYGSLKFLPIPRYMFTHDMYDFGVDKNYNKYGKHNNIDMYLDYVTGASPNMSKYPIKREHFERWIAVKPTSSPFTVYVGLKDKEIFQNEFVSHSFEIDIIQRPSISASTSTICNSGGTVTYNLQNARFDSRTMKSMSISWNAKSNLSLASGQGTTSATFRATTNNGVGSVYADINYVFKDGSTRNIRLIHNAVKIGAPTVTGFTNLKPGDRLTPGVYYIYLAGDDNLEIQNTNWTLEGGSGVATLTKINNTCAQLNISWGRPDAFLAVRADVWNSCFKTTIAAGLYVSSGYTFRSGTNPLNLTEVDNVEQIKQIRIYSISGQTVYSTKIIDESFNYQNIGLKAGVYIIELIDVDNNSIKKKIFIN